MQCGTRSTKRPPLPKLNTLVRDIYGVLDKPPEIPPGVIEEFGHGLARLLTGRLLDRGVRGALRLSNLGSTCRRKLWYMVHCPGDAEPLSPTTRLKFLYGDLIEMLVLFLAKIAGHEVTNEQETVYVDGIPGHLDALVDGHLVDVKSASSRGMDKFRQHGLRQDDPFGYLTQLGAYAKSKNLSEGSFIAVGKETGEIVLDTYDGIADNIPKRIEDVRRVLALHEAPPRDFSDKAEGAKGNRRLGVPCSYCDYKGKCWPGLQTYGYSNGPMYLTRVVSEPKVRKIG